MPVYSNGSMLQILQSQIAMYNSVNETRKAQGPFIQFFSRAFFLYTLAN